MNPISLEQSLQLVAWTMAVLEFMVAGYALTLNIWQTANRNLAAFLILLAVNSTTAGAMLGAESIPAAKIPAALLAISIPMIQPILLIACISLFRENWRRSRLTWLVLAGYLLAAIPLAATLFDLVTGQGIWLSSLEAAQYRGGYLPLIAYTQGSLSDVIWLTSVSGAGVLVILTLLYFIFLDTQVFPSARRLGWLILLAQLSGIGLNLGLRDRLHPSLPVLLTNLVLAITYSYASFTQMVSERRLQRGPLLIRLTALTLIVTIPILGSTMGFLISQASHQIEQAAIERLELSNQNLKSSLELWLEGEIHSYQSVLNQPTLQSLAPGDKTAALQTLRAAHPTLSQASIADLNGTITASQGGTALASIASQSWFNKILDGAELVAQVWDHPNFSSPVLLIALPIHDSNQTRNGVGIFSFSLAEISELLAPEVDYPSRDIYVLDEANRVILSSNSSAIPLGADKGAEAVSGELQAENLGAMRFTHENGEAYRAYSDTTAQNWIIVVQQPETTLLEPVVLLQRAAWLLLTVSVLLVALLVWFTIRHTLHPIATLANIADNITSGNLTRTVQVESEDELGNLARSMNNMIAQMRGLITNLEQRVADRTQDVQRRAIQLQVTADVASEAASIRELERLLDHTVHLISERFDFYHSGIFLIDDVGEYAVLRAASSEGGQRMLARKHKLRVGQTGIVGYVAEKGESRVALDVGQDAVYFNNPDLPQTRSEAALPFKVRDRVIGVLDVQSPRAEAFNPEDIQILQVLADQIALAIDNARLFDENRQALSELQSLYSAQVREAWHRRLEDRSITYAYDRLDVQAVTGQEQAIDLEGTDDPNTIEAAIELRGWQLGSLILKREPNQAPWSLQDRELLQDTARQIALALDNARLLETVQRNAYHEQVIGRIAAKTQSSLVLENVMKTAVQEIGQAIQASRVQIRLHSGNGGPPDGNKPDQNVNAGAKRNG